jgi:hypothetical protein
VDLLVVGAFELVCFLRGEREVAEALVRTVSARRESRVIGIDGAQGVAVAGEVELDLSQGERAGWLLAGCCGLLALVAGGLGAGGGGGGVVSGLVASGGSVFWSRSSG